MCNFVFGWNAVTAGILHFCCADELAALRSSLFCMVFCILAMSMNLALAGRFAI